MYFKSSLLTVALLAMIIVGITKLEIAGETDMVSVVAHFNQSVTEQNMDRALEQLAEGSVHFKLQPSQTREMVDPLLLTDLRQDWRAIEADVYSKAKKYLRSSKILSVEQHGDIATIWVNTSTETQVAENLHARHSNFSEVYLLVKKDDIWQIAANAENKGIEQDG